ncbi:hypothetical protein P7C70_g4008, partial [Phenoliferia sp. Uapishka_3]
MSVRSARTLVRLNHLSSPVASTSTLKAPTSGPRVSCPGCKTSTFSTVASAPGLLTREADSGRSERDQSSWSTITNTLFPPADTSSPAKPTVPPPLAEQTPTLSATAQELINEALLTRPDPVRTWTLFSQLDYEGTTHTLPLNTLHRIIPALRPPRVQTLDHASKSSPITLGRATTRAKAYEEKVERVRTRILEAGGRMGPVDLNAMLYAYHGFGYAPGACKVWDEIVENNWAIGPSVARSAFEAMTRWVDLHQSLGGKELAKVAAQPLVQKALLMMRDITGDGGTVLRRGEESNSVVTRRAALETAIPSLFNILAKAKDTIAFAAAMKTFYGFDMNLPGAEVDSPTPVLASRRALGDEQILWMFHLLADEGTPHALSSMIAIFEVCDNPAPPTTVETPYFGTSFSLRQGLDSDSRPIVATKAISYIIAAAGKQRQGHVVRHYLSLLYWRWVVSADRLIREMESIVGIQWQSKLSPGKHAATSTGVETLSDAPSSVPVPSAVSAELPFMARGKQALQRDYRMSSRFIADTVQQAKSNLDYPTAAFARKLTKNVLENSGEHTIRLAAVLDRLEPVEPSSLDLVSGEAAPLLPTAQKSSAAIDALSRELTATLFHQTQLRIIHTRVKADSLVVHNYGRLRTLVAAGHQRARLLESVSKQSGAMARTTRASLRAKENKILRTRLLTERSYIQRLQVMGKATPGNPEYDEHLAKWRKTKQELLSKGAEVQEEADDAEAGWTPDDATDGKLPPK